MDGHGGGDLLCLLVLAVVVGEVALRVNRVHDDGVVHLEMAVRSSCVSKKSKNSSSTHDVVLVLVLRSGAVVNSIGFGHLLDLTAAA